MTPPGIGSWLTVSEIAERTGWSRDTVRRMLRRARVQVRRVGSHAGRGAIVVPVGAIAALGVVE